MKRGGRVLEEKGVATGSREIFENYNFARYSKEEKEDLGYIRVFA